MELVQTAETVVRNTVAIARFVGERAAGGAFAKLAEIVGPQTPAETVSPQTPAETVSPQTPAEIVSPQTPDNIIKGEE